MASYQDLDARLSAVERKLEFTMRLLALSRVEGVIDKKVVQKNVLDLYYEAQNLPSPTRLAQVIKDTLPMSETPTSEVSRAT